VEVVFVPQSAPALVYADRVVASAVGWLASYCIWPCQAQNSPNFAPPRELHTGTFDREGRHRAALSRQLAKSTPVYEDAVDHARCFLNRRPSP
jgi:hypothetical protein